MRARYLVRLDDASHHMDRARWCRIERILDAHAVKPIVAVVPDNQDPRLKIDPADPAFWDRVRGWDRKGWSVAMHGHQHLMHASQTPPMLPYYQRSEFAGLPLEEQAAKVRASWQLFTAQGVQPRLWVAPAHSFDVLTLKAVERETPIRVVSDGVAWDTYDEFGFSWIPQQLWNFAERPSGLWTVCLHPNTMDDAAFDAVNDALAGRYGAHVVCIADVYMHQRGKTLLDRLYARYFWWRRGRASLAF